MVENKQTYEEFNSKAKRKHEKPLKIKSISKTVTDQSLV